jgi:phosphohistidine phosphatase SixA
MACSARPVPCARGAARVPVPRASCAELGARRRLVFAASALPALLLLPAAPARASTAATPRLALAEAAGRLLEGGWILMMRHASTEPGIGDPPGFRLDRCDTQRNLSAEGRRQARAAGEAMRSAGIALAEVRSSRWCRCRDTAELAFGRHEPWPALDSFFDAREDGPDRTAQLLAYAATLHAPANAMLVTHQVNVVAATGVSPLPGEVVAARWREAALRPEFAFRPA